MKICKRCNQIESLLKFQKNRSVCKSCIHKEIQPGGHRYEKHLELCKKYRDRNKESKKVFNKQYKSDNPEIYKNAAKKRAIEKSEDIKKYYREYTKNDIKKILSLDYLGYSDQDSIVL